MDLSGECEKRCVQVCCLEINVKLYRGRIQCEEPGTFSFIYFFLMKLEPGLEVLPHLKIASHLLFCK